MAYDPTIWTDDTVPDIDADNLNHIEQGIANADSDITQLKNDVSDINDVLIEQKVYIPQPTVSYLGNYTINASGRITAHNNYNAYVVTLGIVEKIHVNHADIYGYYVSTPAVNVDASDLTRHFGTDDSDIEPPTGTKYVVIVATVASGNTITAKNAVNYKTVLDSVEEINEELNKIIDKNGGYEILLGVKTAGHWITYTGEDRENSAWNYYTYTGDFGGISFTITTKSGTNARTANFYDSNDSLIGTSSAQTGVETRTETVTAPNGTVKIIVNTNDTSNDPSVKQLFDAISSDHVFYNDKSLSDVIGTLESQKGPLYGKVICCCGDSITYGSDMDAEGFTDESDAIVYQSDASGNFAQITSNFRMTWNWNIANRNAMTLYNAGVGGSTMQGMSNHNGFSLANGRYTKLPDDIDYLLIWFGWNDTAYGTLGTIDDATNESYYGGYNVVIPYLQNKYPYTKIALIVPFGCDAEHRNAVRQLGNKWGLAVWDNYQGGTPLYYGKEDSVGVKASVVYENRTKFQANGAHPNHYGHKQLGDMIEEFLKGI